MSDLPMPGVCGFTGSRHGLTTEQIGTLATLLMDVDVLHHGDCVGADSIAHQLAFNGGTRIVIHPPTDSRLREWNKSPWMEPAKPYLDRNRDIVDQSDLLIATPAEDSEQEKGGTWYTVRYARLRQKPVVIIWPDGTTQSDETGSG